MAKVPVVTLLKQLMEIPSVSEEEEEIGLFLDRYLRDLGYTVELVPITKGSRRRNVYAYMGNNRKARTMLTSHMDTVPPHIPLRIEGDIIYGRGSCDDKGPLAAQIIALEELRAEDAVKDGDVSLLFVVGEEKGGPGMLAANDLGLTWEAVIFGEPTEGTMATGHKGHYVFELFASGVSCHSGYPHLGRSATDILLSVLDQLRDLELPTSEVLGPTTYHCGKLEGGAAYNVIANNAYALCAIRVAANLQEIEEKVATVIGNYPDVELKKNFAYPETILDYAFEGESSIMHEWFIANVATFPIANINDTLRLTYETGIPHKPVAFGTDIQRLQGAHKKFLYGPGSILHAHGPNEQVAIPDLIECVSVYKRLVLAALASKAEPQK